MKGWCKVSNPNGTIHLTAELSICTALDTPKGRVVAIDPAYSGGVIRVSGWAHALVIDISGLVIPKEVPLAKDHSTRTEDLLGRLTASSDGRQLSAKGFLNRSAAAREITHLYKSGQSLQASVGVQPERTAKIAPGQSVVVNGRTVAAPDDGLILIEAGTLREISIVGIGADGDTEVTIEAAMANHGVEDMEDDKQGITLERERCQKINAMAAEYTKTLRAGQAQELRDHAIENGLTADQFSTNILAALRDNRPAPSVTSRGNSRPATDQADVLAAAALLNAGFTSAAEAAYDETTLSQAADMRVTNTVDLAVASLRAGAEHVPANRGEMVRAAFSSLNLPRALQGANQAILLESFRSVPGAWRQIADRRSVTNFHEHHAVRPYLENGLYGEVGPTGQLKHVSADEDAFAFRIGTFGRIFGVTRQDVINDAIGAVFELQRELGRNAARTLNASFWKLIRDAEADGFFSEDNTNLLAGVDTALCMQSFESALKTLREQADSDGNPIDVQVGALVVPPALEGTGRSILASTEVRRNGDATGTTTPTANPWKDAAELVIEPRLGETAGGSDRAWHLFAKPASVPAVLAGFLNGVEHPVVEEVPYDPSYLGVRFRAYLDFGFALADPRGAIKATGEA